jgi:hypothetical protein
MRRKRENNKRAKQIKREGKKAGKEEIKGNRDRDKQREECSKKAKMERKKQKEVGVKIKDGKEESLKQIDFKITRLTEDRNAL